MSEWWTYSLGDFLMFSPRTYWRLFELYNRDLWPVQIVVLAGAAALPWLARHGGAWQQRLLALLLAVAWAWTAWGFLFTRYDTINWAGGYFAAGFAVQAALLAGIGFAAARLCGSLGGGVSGWVGLALYLIALVLYPLLAPAAGRPWATAEIFGLAPDPTAIGTLGLLLGAPGGRARVLLAIPLLWCILSGATLWTMDEWQAVLPFGAALLVIVTIGAEQHRRKSITM